MDVQVDQVLQCKGNHTLHLEVSTNENGRPSLALRVSLMLINVLHRFSLGFEGEGASFFLEFDRSLLTDLAHGCE